MKAEDVIATAHKLETAGMARSEAEALISEFQSLVAPLATREGLESLEARTATKDDLASLEARMATKEDLASLEARMATKEDLASLEARMATKDELKSAVASLESKMSGMETRLLWRLSLVMIGSGGFLLSILRFFP